jgi:indole-3-glycerol phosphate synthase
MGFLTDIVERVRRDLERDPPDEGHLSLRVRSMPPARDFAAALSGPGVSIVAEVKRASPSAGDIAAAADPGEQAARYEAGGAAAISVLTEPRHFGGSLLDLRLARRKTTLPILRKDFVVHPGQVLEARAEGADAVLLISASLTLGELRDLRDVAESLGMAALVEAHGEEDLDRALASGARLVGVNARDLETLDVDLDRAVRLASAVPADRLLVLESGMSTRADVARAEEVGARAVLIGEALMRSTDPARTIRKLRGVLAPVGEP